MTWHDRHSRSTSSRTDSVDVGTNGGVAYVRPASVPARSDTVLVVSYAYNSAGWLQDVLDPRGIVSHTDYDDLGRTIATISAFVDGIPSNNDDRTTRYTYDGNSNILTVTADVPGVDQVTRYVYGVRTTTLTPPATGSAINSNDILAAMQYPDKTTGLPSAGEQESYSVNALGQRVTFTDRNGSTHVYGYDVLGRLVSDTVVILGAGVDGSVREIDIGYDTAGRAALFTSFDAPGGAIVNQVQREFNGLGQLITEYQEHGGAVNTATSPAVRYAYSEMAGGANHSRLISMTYPNGRQIDYNYEGVINDRISRLSSISETVAGVTTTLEAYKYLGLSTVVERSHPEPNVRLTYIKRNIEPIGDAGDQYTGLDRFGRVVDQRWRKGNTDLDRFQYRYDRTASISVNDFGNVILYTFDGIGRQLETDTLLSVTGQGNGAFIGADIFGVKQPIPAGYLDTAQAGDGLITQYFAWDQNSQMLARRDDNGNLTQYIFDNQNRTRVERKAINFSGTTFTVAGGDNGSFTLFRVGVAPVSTRPGFTDITSGYDRDSNLVNRVDEAGNVFASTFDSLNRRTALNITPAAGFIGTTQEVWTFDGLGRQTSSFDNNEPTVASDDVRTQDFYDSLSRNIEEDQQIGSLPAKAISFQFDIAASNSVYQPSALVYPDSRQVNNTYDNLDRLVSRTDNGQSSPIGTIQYIGVGRVATLTFQNKTRLSYFAGTTDVGYDGLRRVGQHRWEKFTPTTPLGSGSLLVGFAYTYDRANNRLSQEKLHDPGNSEDHRWPALKLCEAPDRWPRPTSRSTMNSKL